MKKLQKKLKKLNNKLNSAYKIINKFFKQTKKNYQTMKQNLFKLFACATLVAVAAASVSCNVTRKVTTESSYYQKGDTTTSIIVKTIESYDASKKN